MDVFGVDVNMARFIGWIRLELDELMMEYDSKL